MTPTLPPGPPAPTHYKGVRIPAPATLSRYGLGLLTWKRFVRQQGAKCGVCKGLPASGVLHIDHEHAPGWARMAERDRALYVRGLLCFPCNKYALGAVRTLDRAEAIYQYLDRYERRRP